MDRCALFVDAGYLLADGAMAVHGTRRREAVAWDYPGLIQLLTDLSRERTGLPALRCYWYEATVEGRHTPSTTPWPTSPASNSACPASARAAARVWTPRSTAT
nr:hypothetical protein GCM10020093_079700 [Planobispora longispora]